MFYVNEWRWINIGSFTKLLDKKEKKYDTITIEKRRPEPNAGSVGKRGGTP